MQCKNNNEFPCCTSQSHLLRPFFTTYCKVSTPDHTQWFQRKDYLLKRHLLMILFMVMNNEPGLVKQKICINPAKLVGLRILKIAQLHSTHTKNVSARPFPISPTSFISFVLWCLVFCQSVFESIFRMGSNEEMSLVAADMAAVKFTETYWSLRNALWWFLKSINLSIWRS